MYKVVLLLPSLVLYVVATETCGKKEDSTLMTCGRKDKESDDDPSYKKDKPRMVRGAHDLRTSYAYDYEEALRIRQKNMKKYDFPYNVKGIDRREKLSYQEYLDVYDGKWPVVVTDVVPTWPAINWTVAFLRENYGNARVTVQTVSNGKKEGLAMPLRLFLDHLHVSTRQVWTYVEDEIFLMQRPRLKADLLPHVYSAKNLFDLFPEEIRPWDAFFLLGTSHSHSTLHVDPYNWTATSAVIFGSKRWKLLPPGQDAKLQVNPFSACGFPLDCRKYNSQLDPISQPKALQGVRYMETTCHGGDMLIIPTGWFHQAYNEVPTMAVSGQIMNPTNHLVVLEEVLKGDNLPRSAIAPEFSQLSPRRRVKYVMSQVPEAILEKGEELTRNYLDAINHKKQDDD